MHMLNIPAWLYIWISQALVGEIYPEVRAIVVKFGNDNKLLLRCYFDREPTEDDFENFDSVLSEVYAQTSSDAEISDLQCETVYSEAPFKDLDFLDGCVYARREWVDY